MSIRGKKNRSQGHTAGILALQMRISILTRIDRDKEWFSEDRPGEKVGENRPRQLEILGELFHSFSGWTADCGSDYNKKRLKKPRVQLVESPDCAVRLRFFYFLSDCLQHLSEHLSCRESRFDQPQWLNLRTTELNHGCSLKTVISVRKKGERVAKHRSKQVVLRHWTLHMDCFCRSEQFEPVSEPRPHTAAQKGIHSIYISSTLME